MLNLGPQELILILVIALVIVGPHRLPELGRTIGKGMRELRKMQDEVKDLVNTGMGEEFKETAAELKRTASDLKSATDVRSAFRADPTRSRRRGQRAIEGSSTPEPDQPGPNQPAQTDEPTPARSDAPARSEAPAQSDAPSGSEAAPEASTPAASPVEADEPGPDA